ncbi:hypothetical protein [Pseudoxanthomonas wuyuanensis]|nr:hypothetical protein [Pseudoxanthomonas wuyuanensis]KAF1720237.1 hypothetical protein CSC75_11750 [Pseudoxanthomonas wuyuanensis]
MNMLSRRRPIRPQPALRNRRLPFAATLSAALALAGCASTPAALPPQWDATRLELPADWRVLAGARGDLNRDGRRDIALLMGASAAPAEGHARANLLVFLSQADGRYRLAERSGQAFTRLQQDCAPARCSEAVTIRRGVLWLEERYQLQAGPYLRQQRSGFRVSADRDRLLLTQSQFRLGNALTGQSLEVAWNVDRGVRRVRRITPGAAACDRQDDKVPASTALSDFEPELVAAAGCQLPGQAKPMLNFSS